MTSTGLGELVSEVATLYEGLDTLSYYEFLALDPKCDYLAVRDAFYARAQRFHPDRFLTTAGESVKHAVYAVYKRMTESYNVLSDPELRRAYDGSLRDSEVRLAAESRARRLDAEERQVSNALARIYLRAGRAKVERGELNAAFIDVELGLSLEDSQPLRDLRDRIIRHLARPADEPLGARS